MLKNFDDKQQKEIDNLQTQKKLLYEITGAIEKILGLTFIVLLILRIANLIDWHLVFVFSPLILLVICLIIYAKIIWDITKQLKKIGDEEFKPTGV